MAKDYYEILGISKDSTEDEIKKAYRKLAREWHPDVAKDKPEAEAKFKELNEAYQVLSNPQKRSQYDQFGASGFEGMGGNGAGGSGFNPFEGFAGSGSGPFQWSYSTSGAQGQGQPGFDDPFDIFEQVFGFRGFGGQRRGRSVRYTLNLDFVDSVKGFEDTIEIDGKKLKIKLPPGVRDGTQVKFPDQGETPTDGRPPGDLYINIDINPHPEIARQGMDVFSVREISMAQAAVGDKVKVQVVDPSKDNGFDHINVKIPAGTQPGSQIRLKGYGMPNPNGFGRGDHYLTIKVEIPEKLTKNQKKALEEHFLND